MKTKNDLHIPFTWEDRRVALLDRFCYVPGRIDHAESERLNWSEIFGNENPVHMEICCGNGRWIAEKAKAYPNVNWIGVDMEFERARKTWVRSFREDLPNLYTVCSEAGVFIRHYAGSVDAVYVNFPDPWPKRRHAKKRLVQERFLQDVRKILRGTVTLATDYEPYYAQMIKEFEKAGGWKRETFDGGDYGSSYFFDLWVGKGLTIYYLRYQNGI